MPSHASPISPPPLSRYPLPMAVLFLSQDDNKENIPPFFPKQATLITKFKSPLPTSNKRRVRRPLEDITALFNPEIYSTSALDNRIYIFHSLPSACKVRSGKRRAEDGVDPTCKKTTQQLLSSKNFRQFNEPSYFSLMTSIVQTVILLTDCPLNLGFIFFVVIIIYYKFSVNQQKLCNFLHWIDLTSLFDLLCIEITIRIGI